MDAFKIFYKTEKVLVLVDENEGRKTYEVCLPNGIKVLTFNADHTGSVHWHEMPGGETDLATELGKAIETSYIRLHKKSLLL